MSLRTTHLVIASLVFLLAVMSWVALHPTPRTAFEIGAIKQPTWTGWRKRLGEFPTGITVRLPPAPHTMTPPEGGEQDAESVRVTRAQKPPTSAMTVCTPYKVAISPTRVDGGWDERHDPGKVQVQHLKLHITTCRWFAGI